jgi:Ca-activated chloride channel homolog
MILANESHNPGDALQTESLTIIDKAKKIYGKLRKKKKVG